MLSWVGYARRFMVCVGVLVGDDGSCVGKVWLSSSVVCVLRNCLGVYVCVYFAWC